MVMLEALIELGRRDLQNLSNALASYRRTECQLKAAQALAVALGNPVDEMKAEELGGELESLRQLAHRAAMGRASAAGRSARK